MFGTAQEQLFCWHIGIAIALNKTNCLLFDIDSIRILQLAQRAIFLLIGGIMNYVPEIAAISDMRVRSGEIVAAARRGPVILIEKGSRPALIVVSPEQWNNLMERLELLEDTIAVYQTRLNQALGKSKAVPFKLAEYDLEETTKPTEIEGQRVSVGN